MHALEAAVAGEVPVPSLMNRFLGPTIADFNALRTKGVKKYFQDKMDEAPPAVRYLDVGYVPLYRKDGNNSVFVGSFAPEIYELGKAGSLRCQIEAHEWLVDHFSQKRWARVMPEVHSKAFGEILLNEIKAKRSSAPKSKELEKLEELYTALFRADGSPKTPFELGIIPSNKLQAVEEHFKREYQFQRDRQQPLPAMISKFICISDYLEKCAEAGLETKEGFYGIKLNLRNPPDKATLREKILHYTGNWAAWISTLATALSVTCIDMALGLSSPMMALTVFAATYLANKCARDFAFYDVAEALYRDIGWLFNQKLSREGKFSFSRTFETLLYLAAGSLAVYGAVVASWAGIMALPWATLLNAGFSASLVYAAQVASAGFLTAMAGLISVTGIMFTQRYFWGLSFWDNQIDFKDKDIEAGVKALPAIALNSEAQVAPQAAPQTNVVSGPAPVFSPQFNGAKPQSMNDASNIEQPAPRRSSRRTARARAGA